MRQNYSTVMRTDRVPKHRGHIHNTSSNTYPQNPSICRFTNSKQFLLFALALPFDKILPPIAEENELTDENTGNNMPTQQISSFCTGTRFSPDLHRIEAPGSTNTKSTDGSETGKFKTGFRRFFNKIIPHGSKSMKSTDETKTVSETEAPGSMITNSTDESKTAKSKTGFTCFLNKLMARASKSTKTTDKSNTAKSKIGLRLNLQRIKAPGSKSTKSTDGSETEEVIERVEGLEKLENPVEPLVINRAAATDNQGPIKVLVHDNSVDKPYRDKAVVHRQSGSISGAATKHPLTTNKRTTSTLWRFHKLFNFSSSPSSKEEPSQKDYKAESKALMDDIKTSKVSENTEVRRLWKNVSDFLSSDQVVKLNPNFRLFGITLSEKKLKDKREFFYTVQLKCNREGLSFDNDILNFITNEYSVFSASPEKKGKKLN